MPARPRAASKRASVTRSKRFWPARTSSSVSNASRRPLSAGDDLPRVGLRHGVAAVVLPLGHAARSGTAGRGESRRADAPPRRSRSRRAACSPIRAPTRSARASPGSGCACRTSTRSTRIRTSTRTSTSSSAGLMRRETELFFVNMIREDRSVLDLLRADYSFMNEQLARHYGIGGVAGHRVPPRDVSRRHAARPVRPGQHAGADLVREPHVAGACAASG